MPIAIATRIAPDASTASVKDGSWEDLSGFLKTYPNGQYKAGAQMKMAKLEAAAFNTAKQGDDLEKLKAFVKKYPSSSLKGTAEKQIAAIVNKTFEAEWFEASESQNPKLLAAFIKKHGKSAKAEGAKQNYEQAVAFWRSL